MTNRREFLQIGIAATAWPIASRTAFGATATDTATRVPLYKAVYDTRFSESVAFGRKMEEQGVTTHAFAADITPFWYNELDAIWSETPAAIAGLTAHGPLFCLEQLGWPKGMRVVFRAEHRIGADGCLHTLDGPASMVRGTNGLHEDADWAARMAVLATRCPGGRNELARTTVRGPASGAPRDEDDPLISWVIAPAAKA